MVLIEWDMEKTWWNQALHHFIVVFWFGGVGAGGWWQRWDISSTDDNRWSCVCTSGACKACSTSCDCRCSTYPSLSERGIQIQPFTDLRIRSCIHWVCPSTSEIVGPRAFATPLHKSLWTCHHTVRLSVASIFLLLFSVSRAVAIIIAWSSTNIQQFGKPHSNETNYSLLSW